MKAVLYYKYGDSGELLVSDITVPQIKPNQVLIKIHASGINPIDWKIRKGDLEFWAGIKFPKIPGIEAAGEIVETGELVNIFKTGNKVILFTGFKGGCCTDYYAAKVDQLFPMPEIISYNEAAALSVTNLTALQAIRDIAYVNSDSRILINGASGGVGTAAIQIAKIYYGHVTAVCSEANFELVKGLGADEVIDYQKTDILTHEGEYDSILDTVGNLRFQDVKNILNKGGYLICTNPDPAFFISVKG